MSPTLLADAYSPVDSICEELPDAVHIRRSQTRHRDLMLTLSTMRDTPSSNFWHPSNVSYTLLSTRKRSQSLPSLGSVSPATSLVYPKFSPPFQENTPFDRQFSSDFPSLYSQLTECSPIARKDSFHSSPSVLSSLVRSEEPSQNGELSSDCFSSQPVSLMEKFLSVAPGNFTFSPPSDHRFHSRTASPYSAVSTLTPLSSQSIETPYTPNGTDTPLTSPFGYTGWDAPNTQTQECVQLGQGIDVDFPPVDSSPSFDVKPRRQAARRLKSGGRKRKRALSKTHAGTTTNDHPKAKKARTASQTETVLFTSEGDTSTRRRVPSSIQYHSQFTRFYRRFPASSYLESTDGMSVSRYDLPMLCLYFHHCSLTLSLSRLIPLLPGLKSPGGVYNPPYSVFDLYTPRFVKGRGTTKVGLCPVCVEHPSRGGNDEKIWLSMKFSAYK